MPVRYENKPNAMVQALLAYVTGLGQESKKTKEKEAVQQIAQKKEDTASVLAGMKQFGDVVTAQRKEKAKVAAAQAQQAAAMARTQASQQGMNDRQNQRLAITNKAIGEQKDRRQWLYDNALTSKQRALADQLNEAEEQVRHDPSWALETAQTGQNSTSFFPPFAEQYVDESPGQDALRQIQTRRTALFEEAESTQQKTTADIFKASSYTDEAGRTFYDKSRFGVSMPPKQDTGRDWASKEFILDEMLRKVPGGGGGISEDIKNQARSFLGTGKSQDDESAWNVLNGLGLGKGARGGGGLSGGLSKPLGLSSDAFQNSTNRFNELLDQILQGDTSTSAIDELKELAGNLGMNIEELLSSLGQGGGEGGGKE